LISTSHEIIRYPRVMTNPDSTQLQNASRAVMAVFLVHGIMLGAWVTQIPLAKVRLDAGYGWFGIALLSMPIGSVIAMTIAAAMINKYGSAIVTCVAGLAFAALIALPSFAPNLPLFMLGGMLLGASVGSMDVAMNAHGIAVEKALKKPVMSGYHGGFSLGAAIGTLGGAWLLGQVGSVAQLASMCIFGAVGVYLCYRYFLSADVDKGLSGTHFGWPTKATIGLGALCFLALMVEGSVMDWGAILFQKRFLVDASIAAMAFGFYQGGMAISRFAGDSLRARFGAVPLVAVSAILTAVGTAAGIFLPNLWLSMIAFTIGGIGIGNTAPVLFAGGGRLEPDAPGRGIAAVTTMGYSGFLAGPPLIGFIAEFTNLQWGLGVTVIAALIIAAFARMVKSADTY
jgi:MFS family permease